MIDRNDLCRRVCWVAAGLATSAWVAGGCASKPVRRYQVRQTQLGLLAASAPEPVANTYMIFQRGETVGRFPCAVSVVRVTGALPDDVAEGGDVPRDLALALDLLTEDQAVPWTELFDNLPAVTAVKVMGRPVVPFENVTVTELIRAGRKQHTQLILIYGQNDLPRGRVRWVGALYDTVTQDIIAAINAQVDPVPGLPTPPDRVKQDRRHEDPECLTARRFQDLVLECLFELSQLDSPSPTIRPNPWDRPGVQPMLSPWTERLYDR